MPGSPEISTTAPSKNKIPLLVVDWLHNHTGHKGRASTSWEKASLSKHWNCNGDKELPACLALAALRHQYKDGSGPSYFNSCLLCSFFYPYYGCMTHFIPAVISVLSRYFP